MMKWAFTGLFFCFLLGLLGCKDSSESGVEKTLPTIDVAEVLAMPLLEWDEFLGHLEAVEQVAVMPRVSGYLKAIHFQEGSVVEKGDLLFELDNAPFQPEVQRLVAERKKAMTVLDLARKNISVLTGFI